MSKLLIGIISDGSNGSDESIIYIPYSPQMFLIIVDDNTMVIGDSIKDSSENMRIIFEDHGNLLDFRNQYLSAREIC